MLTEHKAVSTFVQDKFCKNFKLIKLKESAWSRVFLVSCQKPKQRIILKYSFNKADIEHEYRSLLLLKKNGISGVPQVIACEKYGKFYFLCLNFIENNQKIDLKGQMELAAMLAKIHSIKSRGPSKNSFEQVNKILSELSCLAGYLNQPKHLSLYKKCEKLIQRLKKKSKANRAFFVHQKELSFINGDLADDSIYYHHGKINIIDWHTSGFGDNAWDLVRLFSNNPLINKKLFLKEYLALVDGPYFMKRFETYWPLNKLFTVLFFYLQSEWHSFPMQYASQRFVEENIDRLLKE